jgi:DNA-binding MarR family transcriptional regulator
LDDYVVFVLGTERPAGRSNWKMARDLTQKDYEALAEVRYEIRRFLNFSEGMARGASIEPQQHQLLLALRALPAGVRPTIGVLSKRLLIRHHSAVELAGRSVKAGLLRRIQSEEDRREVTLRMTPHGERILAALSVVHRAELRSAAPALVRALTAILDSDQSEPEGPARPPTRRTTRRPVRRSKKVTT